MSFRSSKFGLKSSLSDYNTSGKSSTKHFQGLTKMSAQGGTILTPGNQYRYHIFTSPGTFIVVSGGYADYIIVGGGGAGGNGFSPFYDSGGAGGGAGGYLST